MIIRPETTEDRPAIYHINLQAFSSTVEPQLVDRLRDSDWFIPDLSLTADYEHLFSCCSVLKNTRVLCITAKPSFL